QTVTCPPMTITNTLATGDILNLNDQGNATTHTYTLTGTTLDRTSMATITYATVETVNLNAGMGTDTINVTTTAASVNTNIATTAGGDTVTVTTTGASSNLVITGDA